MRDPWISEDGALRERMSDPAQVTAADPEARLPGYATAFLAHLRLLVGVPFEYLVPDTAMLPDESIRFFHLDRSWTDRVVDGVLAVGKVGSREQAHHHAPAPGSTHCSTASNPRSARCSGASPRWRRPATRAGPRSPGSCCARRSSPAGPTSTYGLTATR